MKITGRTRDFETVSSADRQDGPPPIASDRQTVEINWAESEFFEVWLKLAREGRERDRN